MTISTSCSKQSSCADLATGSSLIDPIWKQFQDDIPTKYHTFQGTCIKQGPLITIPGRIGPGLGVLPGGTNYTKSPDRLDVSQMSTHGELNWRCKQQGQSCNDTLRHTAYVSRLGRTAVAVTLYA